jgi:methionyl-tRNA formyltransferase
MMLLDDGVDTGDIIAQRRFAIDLDDTCATVYDKVAASEVDMIRETMPLIRAGRMPRRPQDHGAATVMPRRRPEDGVMDWNKTAKELHDWIRALTHPYPGAFTTLRGERVFIWKARPLSSGRPGRAGGGWRRTDADSWREQGTPIWRSSACRFREKRRRMGPSSVRGSVRAVRSRDESPRDCGTS